MKNTSNEVNPSNILVEDPDDNRKVNAHQSHFIDLDKIPLPISLKELNSIFNSYSTKKTIATGFFNIALVASNFGQLKNIVQPPGNMTQTWSPLIIVSLVFICLSLSMQFILALMLVFLAKNGEFVDEEKRNQLIRNNNFATLLALVITILNICIDVFVAI